MKKILRFIGQAICLLLLSAGLLAALGATFCLGAMAIIWFQEGTLQTDDRWIVTAGVKWLLGSCTLVGAAWWLGWKMVGDKKGDSFRLVESKSGRSEELVQKISSITAFFLLTSWLWARVPGSAIVTGPTVLGWLIIGFLGTHAWIAVHELAHLAAARLVGFELRKMEIGTGPLLWSRSFANGLVWEWRAWSLGGFVLATPRKMEGFRLRQSLIVAAGPLADLIILWLTYQFIIRAFGGLVAALGQGAGGLIAFILYCWMAFSAAGGLIPHKVLIGHHKLGTDGYWLLRLWTGGAEVVDFASRSNWRELLELFQSDRTPNVAPLESTEPKLRTLLTNSRVLQEQRALLSSRLLRKEPLTSAPPA